MRAVGEAEGEYGALDLRLEGGTALAAYHLGHRQSADLDFFGDPAMHAGDFGRFLGGRLAREGILLTPVGLTNQGFARYEATVSGSSTVQPVLLDLARTSPFRIAVADHAAEGIRVASYRDLCAGKLHAVCGRFEPRDFLDLHVILHHAISGSSPSDHIPRERFTQVMRDTLEADPGLSVPYIAQAITRGVGRPLVAVFPLRLLIPMAEQAVQHTLQLCLEECAAIIRGGWTE
jgi:hypothetical protein